MQSHADVGLGLLAVKNVVGGGVRAHDSAESGERGVELIHAAGRKFREDVAEGDVDVGLVEGDPVGDEISERAHGALGVVAKELRGLRVEESATSLKPARVSEVMERDEDAHAAAAGGAQKLAITHDGPVAPVGEGGLHAAPFNRDAQGVEAQRGAEVEIALGVGPPVAGRTAQASADVGTALPVMPLVERVATLELVRTGGDAPEKILGERYGDDLHGCSLGGKAQTSTRSAAYGWAGRAIHPAVTKMAKAKQKAPA